MNRRTALPAMSAKRRAALAAAGQPFPTSTLARSRELKTPAAPKMAVSAPIQRAKRVRYTGPTPATCALVDTRSGKMCEFPGCVRPQDHRHHRLNRKSGGRHGEMATRLNGAAWLLGVCFVHHEIVTNPPKGMVDTFERMGWILREGQDATQVEVFTRHQVDPVWLTDAGLWVDYADAAA